MTTAPLLLLSQSPRRRELLASLDIEFEVKKIEVEEYISESLTPSENAEAIALQKFRGYEFQSNELAIASDTIVVFRDVIFGKPDRYEQAVEMLTALSNNKHEVITGVCIGNKNKYVTFHEVTNVYFRQISLSDIQYYIEKYRPYDKAGAYGIQEWLGKIAIERIEGCYYNVVGLPLSRLYHELMKFDQ